MSIMKKHYDQKKIEISHASQILTNKRYLIAIRSNNEILEPITEILHIEPINFPFYLEKSFKTRWFFEKKSSWNVNINPFWHKKCQFELFTCTKYPLISPLKWFQSQFFLNKSNNFRILSLEAVVCVAQRWQHICLSEQGYPPSLPQILANQLTQSQPWGTDYAHQITASTPGFENLTTSLTKWYVLFMYIKLTRILEPK